MKNLKLLIVCFVICCIFIAASCDGPNQTAKQEQAHIEKNQMNLNSVQPSPDISWSLERDNLIKRFKLENDRSTMFYMYVFVEGVSDPIGYYQVNKISSVNSQLTNPEQLVNGVGGGHTQSIAIASPAEDGSYGSNGEGVFGFTPEDIYIEHNMKYIVSTVPLSFTKPVNRLTVINVKTQLELKELMSRIKSK